jgi:hypothetical protein
MAKRNADDRVRDLERAAAAGDPGVTVPWLKELMRVRGSVRGALEEFLAKTVELPAFGGTNEPLLVNFSMPDAVDRPEGLLVSLDFSDVPIKAWSDLDFENNPVPEMVRRRAEEVRRTGVYVRPEEPPTERQLLIVVEIAPGLHHFYYRHSGMRSGLPWNRFWQEYTLRESQITEEDVLHGIVVCADLVWEKMIRAGDKLTELCERVGITSPHGSGSYQKTIYWIAGHDISKMRYEGSASWFYNLAHELLLMIRPPAQGLDQEFELHNAAGEAYSWSAARRLTKRLMDMGAVVDGVELDPSFGPTTFSRRRMTVRTRVARRTGYPIEIVIDYPSLMNHDRPSQEFVNEHPAGGKFTLGWSERRTPATVRALVTLIEQLIIEMFPGSQVWERDTQVYPTDFTGHRVR